MHEAPSDEHAAAREAEENASADPSSLYVPYAFDEKGEVWAPYMFKTASAEARHCRFSCPCGKRVLLRAGCYRRWHFAHAQAREENRCDYFDKLYHLKYAAAGGDGNESITHASAKHLLGLPSFRESVRFVKLCSAPATAQAHEVALLSIDETWQYRSEYLLKTAEGRCFKCDVAFLDALGSLRLVVEVVHTHRLSCDKREWLRGQAALFNYIEIEAVSIVQARQTLDLDKSPVDVVILDSTEGPLLCAACKRCGIQRPPQGAWSLVDHPPREDDAHPPMWWGDRSTLAVDFYAAVGSFMLHFLVPLPPDQQDECHVCDGQFVYRVDPQRIRGQKIDVPDRIDRHAFFRAAVTIPAAALASPAPLLPQNSLRIVQKGAGSGKTYDSIQLLCCDLYRHKSTFVYLTKIHTAKEIIRQEFRDQLFKGALRERLEGGSAWRLYEEDWANGVEVYRAPVSDREDEGAFAVLTETNTPGSSPKYVMRYEHPRDPARNLLVLIGTIDSFVWALDKCMDKSRGPASPPSSLMTTIAPGEVHAEKLHQVTNARGFASKTLKYASCEIDLGDSCLINVDEVQDLPETYVDMFVKIVRGTRVDISVVGDKLQSIWHERNIFTVLCAPDDEGAAIPNVFIRREPPENVVKRFHNPAHLEAVNRAVPFAKYGLPPVRGICARRSCEFSHAPSEFRLFCLRCEEDDEQKRLAALLPKLEEFIRTELEENPCYSPKNFCIVTPFVSTNSALFELTIVCNHLEKLWTELMKGREGVRQPYVFWHKSEDGAKPIDLRDSEGCMRILSIHAAKGMGCDVVFLLKCSEAALKYGSSARTAALEAGGGGPNLMYDSKINVALTRQKRMLYVEIPNVHDDFANRFETGHLKLEPNLQLLLGGSSLSVHQLTRALWSDADKCKRVCATCGLGDAEDASLLAGQTQASAPSSIVDWGDHMLRGALLFWHTLLGIMRTEDDLQCIQAKVQTFFARPISLLPPEKWNEQVCKTRRLMMNHEFDEANKQPVPVLQLGASHVYGAYGKITRVRLEAMKSRYSKARVGGASSLRSALSTTEESKDGELECVLHVLLFHVHFHYSIGIAQNSPVDMYRVVESISKVDRPEKLREHYERLARVQGKCQNLRKVFPTDRLRWQLYDYPVFAAGSKPFKFWDVLTFHGIEQREERGDRVRSLILYLQPTLNENNVRQAMVHQAFTHHVVTHGLKCKKAECERWETATAFITLNCDVKFFGYAEAAKRMDVTWNALERESELNAAFEVCTDLFFAQRHRHLFEVLRHYVEKFGRNAVRKLRRKIEKLQSEKHVSMAGHMDHFLTVFETEQARGADLLGDRERFLQLLDERCEENVRVSLGTFADDGESSDSGA